MADAFNQLEKQRAEAAQAFEKFQRHAPKLGASEPLLELCKVVSLGYLRLAKGLDGGSKASRRCFVGLPLFAKQNSLVVHPGHFVFQVEDIMFFLFLELPKAERQTGNGLVRSTVPFAFDMIEGI
ncbi:hypothetical protein ColTof4_11456 [Colletotrichum tofieldiae]|nr:hypothetical protein ColTof3_04645 [Colletotrichum tofieldiae]GKT79033.1 hypothetical protein ColTof4_11456 [Colletotrichum tofieldiae]GKT86740.1 hypothetical protein Ct61P_04590 [Colletotrichum tofieldiae]